MLWGKRGGAHAPPRYHRGRSSASLVAARVKTSVESSMIKMTKETHRWV